MPLVCLLLVTSAVVVAQEPPETVRLRAAVAATPRLPHQLAELKLAPATEVEMVSSVASNGPLIYILQRGPKADPVIVAGRNGRILRSWGKGLYTIPHSIRLDPEGNVWTVDAGSSRIIQYSNEGRILRDFTVELPAQPKGGFHGATDIAFAPNGDFYISDGYQNNRVIQFNKTGQRIREWGKAGTGPGEFNLPHGIAVDPAGTVYVADRENLRIQKFDLDGKHKGTWNLDGKVFCLKWTANGELWAGTQPKNVPNGAEGWLMRLDPVAQRVTGLIESFGHSIEVTRRGGVLTGRRPGSTLVFSAPAPPRPQWPEPPVITPGSAGGPPSDAIVLFDGKNVDAWERQGGGAHGCKAQGGEMVCATGSGNIQSKHKFHDAQIHLEFNVPLMADQAGQRRGNSGVYLQGRYEIQILDSFQNPTYWDGMLGALYGQAPPLVNAARKPGEWQSYDILFRAHRCGPNGEYVKRGSVTVLLNGAAIHDHVEIVPAADQLLGRLCNPEPGPLLLQDHSGFPGAPHTVMKFRNIWLRPLAEPAKPIP
jgi:sugar lactone lactonase YvrE